MSSQPSDKTPVPQSARAPARASDAELERRVTLLTGASGYVGGRLLGRLERSGRRLRCLSRHPETLRKLVQGGTEVVAGDVLDQRSLRRALRGVHTACYLVHSMGHGSDFEELDHHAATQFGAAAAAAGVSQIVYLGGLGDARDLSPHLASRHEVGELLRAGGVPTVELRASIVIGSGSASFETVRALVEQLPAIVAPPWTETLAQPIAIDDVIASLMTALSFANPVDATYEIGGTDRVTYVQLMSEYARQRGLHRGLLRVPLVTPRVAQSLLPALVPDHGRIAAAMVDSLRNETVVRERAPIGPSPRQSLGVPAAIAQALAEEDREFAQLRFSEALDAGKRQRFGGLAYGRRLVSSRVARLDEQGRADAFGPVERIGGETGWYAANWFWALRGVLDRMRGGVGRRRGRRDPRRLRVGDEVDFWRVECVEHGRLLRLSAEMKMPGRLWLQFELNGAEHPAMLRQTTIFDPAGYVGRAYWYLLYPVHRWVFARMLRGISRAARSEIPAVSRA
ncbi:MAG TPA: DUF2867 domain-containing protein [Solirubrobacteraceae bacterium]|nr:DUF2867 domain-containing protein [Solirubrobacteraceae bacterium]